MLLPRRILPLLPATLLLAASWAQAAKPKPALIPIHASSVSSAHHRFGPASLDSCMAGESNPPGSIADFIYPPDDAYYTLVKVSDCAACATADTALFHLVHIAVETRAPCVMPIQISVVGVSGPEACPTPDLTNIICLPEAFDLIPPPTLGTNDYVFTLSQRCAIVKQAFLVINFSDTVAGCRDSLRRPRLGVSDSECVFCRSYNDFTGPSGLDGIPDDLCGQLGTEANPIMYVEVDSCFDVQPPDPVLDLAAVSTSETSVSLRWTATGDDGRVGRPLRYLIAASTQPVDEVSFDAALKDSVPASVGADSTESFTLGGLAGARTYWIALKARDDAGKLSALSNLTSARTQVGGPLTGRVGPAIAMITQPTRLPVEFFWQGTGEASVGRQLIRIYDVAGRLRRTLDVGGEVNGIEPWDGKDDQGETVQSGVYIARLDSGPRQVRTRVVLVR